MRVCPRRTSNQVLHRREHGTFNQHPKADPLSIGALVTTHKVDIPLLGPRFEESCRIAAREREMKVKE